MLSRTPAVPPGVVLAWISGTSPSTSGMVPANGSCVRRAAGRAPRGSVGHNPLRQVGRHVPSGAYSSRNRDVPISPFLLEPARRVPLAAGLTAVALLLGLEDHGRQVPVLAVAAWVVVAGLLLAERFRPGLAAALPERLRGRALAMAGAAVLAYVALLQVQLALAALVWWAATIVFVAGSARDGGLGAIAPRRAITGWPRRVVTLGGVLVVASMGSNWLGNMYYGYTAGGYDYAGSVAGGTAHGLGRAALPTLLALAAFGIAAWDENSPWFRRLAGSLLGIAVVLGIIALQAMVSDSRHFDELTQGGAAYVLAFGPWLLAAAAVVLAIGGVMLRRDATGAAAGS